MPKPLPNSHAGERERPRADLGYESRPRIAAYPKLPLMLTAALSTGIRRLSGTFRRFAAQCNNIRFSRS